MISLAGNPYKDYSISLTGTIGDPTVAYTGPNLSVTTEFILRIKNPCLDPDFVKIVPNNLLNKTYSLGSYADLSPAGMQWNHAPFTVETYPVQHDQCGEISYEAFFND